MSDQATGEPTLDDDHFDTAAYIRALNIRALNDEITLPERRIQRTPDQP